jgi:hypothetical protein
MVMDAGEEATMGKRRDRTRLLREVREQFRQSVVQENLQEAPVEPDETTDGDARAPHLERILTSVGKRGAPNADPTLQLSPGELINILTVRSHKRWSLEPAIVLDGPDRFGMVLLMFFDSPEPQKVSVRRCRPMG